jgi:exosortase A
MLLNDNPALAGSAPAPAPALPLAVKAMIVLALLAPFLFYFGTAVSIVDIWNSSETFAHGYIIAPISLWLIWRRRANFRALPPGPCWPALAVLAALGAAWLVARMGEVQVVQQYAFVAMLPVIALAVLGRRLAGSLAFPLVFLLFAVPFGEIFIGPLIEFTADFTIWAVQATGIPVLRNGTHFELPTGSWSVVEACSGVRYLISSVTIGCLYAYLTYRSTLRRAVFIGAGDRGPGDRQRAARLHDRDDRPPSSNMTLATGVDHLIYGWIFFGIVMFLMFWIGSYWREDTDAESAALPPATAADASSRRRDPQHRARRRRHVRDLARRGARVRPGFLQSEAGAAACAAGYLGAGRRVLALGAELHAGRCRLQRRLAAGRHAAGRADHPVLPQSAPRQIADQLRQPPGRRKGFLPRAGRRSAQRAGGRAHADLARDAHARPRRHLPAVALDEHRRP